MEFDGRTVVVTGGTGALGQAVVGLLISHGATCIATCLDERELEHFHYPDHDRVTIEHPLDLGDENRVRAFYERFGAHNGLWASIHVAGGFAMGKIEDIALADWDAMMRINAASAFLCSREAVKAMRRSPREDTGVLGGRIVNVCARPALAPRTGVGMAAYTASKAAVASLTTALAAEVAEEGIFVNAVAPSIIDTPANRAAMPKADYDRWPTPAQIAHTIAFLASPANASTHGAIVPVYGMI